jgi:hypothetical protein
MTFNKINKWLTWPVLAFGLTLFTPAPLLAHCDGLDGPVVKAAQKALDTRNPAFALMWVQAKDEREILTAFEQTLAVRALSSEARELADRFFGRAQPSCARVRNTAATAATLTTARRRIRSGAAHPPAAGHTGRRRCLTATPHR